MQPPYGMALSSEARIRLLRRRRIPANSCTSKFKNMNVRMSIKWKLQAKKKKKSPIVSGSDNIYGPPYYRIAFSITWRK